MQFPGRRQRLLLGAVITLAAVGGGLGLTFSCAPRSDAPTISVRPPEASPARLRPVAGLPTATVAAVTRIGHASVLLELGDVTVLTDPWFSEKWHYHPGEPLGMRVEDLPRLTAVIASHAHYDHFDIETFARYPDKAVPFFVGPDMEASARAAGFTNVSELRPWESVTVGPLRVTAAPAAHKVPEVTFVLEAHGTTVYFGGDSRLIPELEDLSVEFPSIQLALLPVNGLSVLGEQVVMNAEEAASLAGLLGAEVAVPMHYRFRGSWFTDTFILRRDGTPERFVAAVDQVAPDTQARILDPGECMRLVR
jgi:L-ascorbate metabolism protein UlaG (beta-lactamase superfamily)